MCEGDSASFEEGLDLLFSLGAKLKWNKSL